LRLRNINIDQRINTSITGPVAKVTSSYYLIIVTYVFGSYFIILMQGDKPEAIKKFHDKPEPTHQQSHSAQQHQNIMQPRKM